MVKVKVQGCCGRQLQSGYTHQQAVWAGIGPVTYSFIHLCSTCAKHMAMHLLPTISLAPAECATFLPFPRSFYVCCRDLDQGTAEGCIGPHQVVFCALQEAVTIWRLLQRAGGGLYCWVSCLL